ncbi:Hint domain-containing protein [Acetobacter pasteurianus]|uniref:Outer membrane protein n=2 Tax=Acetobacter pasteurianus TaxID=438 RepID=C7JDJ7_ACEP3|nr:outer membrane protein [Acetobacter pasteurianus IFO 3283-01]BAI01692.1 outer membrane protein [Acetobacter pasteurianus IFO 3283-03]BAI04740.1 outer membrane protein [Acetobacter pasteurianus IFO 3283-07]BAI07787.1 outer membrane protein [Acetobacter pasteurianus IFO 3283-22]BAI10835.1 outer membrane protein [Acetobacter pasteurianus IFO 3283-26]BAI13883.1 outer membrane protein [Acetobacter pasteurianus IFO 3283-32]BAI16929.1 outer membrane protein [Acetobacter pasteurianus IFO 3283-01-4
MVMATASTIPSSGDYILNFAIVDSKGNVSNIQNSVEVTFNRKTSFTINGTTYTYNYTWGAKGSEQIILGDTAGGYFLLTDASVNISNYTYTNYSMGNSSTNHWQINGTDGTSSSVTFQNRDFVPCFLAGTEISVNGATRKVEDLAVGDRIDVLVNGKTEQKTVTWVGKSTSVAAPFLPLDMAGYPVRIVKDALAEGVPFKDMLITPEHCLYLNGCFVPARMLVNGQSIFYDQSFTSYDYYHVETEDHAIITADGVLTESYLDTGNRRSFRQNGDVVAMPRTRNLTWDDAAAPLNVSRAFVEPLFQQFCARAQGMGLPLRTEAPVVTHESNLYLTAGNGRVIRPLRTEKNHTLFMIPAGIETVYIHSNTSRRNEAIGPFVDDRRTLGVLVGNASICHGNTTRTLTSYLHDEDLAGWNNVEFYPMRWTAGNACLPLGHREPGTVALLALQILEAGPYIVSNVEPEETALRA